MAQDLGSKERSLFAQVVKGFENKQYKKGLKAADQILRKVPNHGNTQAMKALIINSQGHSAEAFALAKVALKCDMKSHICWHVYGLLYRSEKNFDEAIKAYKFALKLEPDSPQIQRDLALLQVQMRDFQGYLQSRRAMVQAKPGYRSNWTALAIAQHLAGDLVGAERTLTTYEETLRSPPSKTDIEHSEALLYKNAIIGEMGETERALEHLDATCKNNSDRTSVMEMRAKYLLNLGQKEEAEKVYRSLLNRNPDYREYYKGLECALDINRDDSEVLKKLYVEFEEKYSRADAARRIPLDFLEGNDFREHADKYLRRMLYKGVPSTFANIKALYSNAAKRDIIHELVEGYASGKGNLQTNGSATKETNGDLSLFESSTNYFLAQHYNYHLSRDLGKAMDAINKAIELSPESVDYHMTKARIWKHYGNPGMASEIMEKARSLDDKDRYINTKSAKYRLRNNENEAALDTMKKFTRNETAGGPLGDLHDMQCVWFITEDGDAYRRQGKLGLALKRYTSVANIFEIWQEDQFDFHSFSLRKGMIRAYIDMFRWEDHLRNHPFYSRAALSAIESYVMLYDNPKLAQGPLTNGVNGSVESNGPDSSEKKKAAKKARKDQQKQEKLDAEKKEAKKTSTAGVGADGEPKKEDEDPLGAKLVQTTEPLRDAMKFLSPLLELSPRTIAAQNWGFEVFFRRKKYLLALRCLLAASSLDPADPTTHEQTVRYKHTLDTLPVIPSQVSEVITPQLPKLLNDATNLSAFIASFLEKHKSSARHVQAALRARQYLDLRTSPQNQRDLQETLDLDNTTLEDAVAGLGLLRDWKTEDTSRDEYIQRAHKRWPEAVAFQSLSQQQHK